MRSILFIGSDEMRCKTLGKVLTAYSESDYSIVTNARDSVTHLEQNEIDTVLIDLSCPAEQFHIVVNYILDRHPMTYIIFLRGATVASQDRMILARGHGSFRYPRNSSELQRFIFRLEKQYPIPPVEMPKQIVKKETAQDKVVVFLDSLESTVSPQALIREISRQGALKTLLLRRINSPFYGIPSQIDSVDRAVRLLGVEGVIELFEETLEAKKVA